MKLWIIFVTLLLVVLVTTFLWVESSPKGSQSALSIQQIRDEVLNGDLCKVAGIDGPLTERQRPITLLSSYPKTGDSFIRTFVEDATNVTSYSQYIEQDPDHALACDYSTGPWELYCRIDRRTGICKSQHPPPPDMDYFVKTHYPLYQQMCGNFGYPLPPRHKIIHIVRNPLDAIEEWFRSDVDKGFHADDFTPSRTESYIDDNVQWHRFWQGYYQFALEPSLWIRYEDLCLCTEVFMREIIRFLGADKLITEAQFLQLVDINQCNPNREIGRALSRYSKDMFEDHASRLDEVIEHFGYKPLMEEMKSQGSKDWDGADAAMLKALWINVHVTDEGKPMADEGLCNSLFSRDWGWYGEV